MSLQERNTGCNNDEHKHTEWNYVCQNKFVGMKSGTQYEHPLEALEWEALCSSEGSVGQGGRFRFPAESSVQMKVSN
jgi:hypothetical protein